MNAQCRLRRSYEMMLGFFGISLDASSVPCRSVNWDERFDNIRRLFILLSLQLFIAKLQLLPVCLTGLMLVKHVLQCASGKTLFKVEAGLFLC